MPRKALNEDEIATYRLAFCEAAYEIFKQDGYAGVTMRGVAKVMGISPMTAYRYFDDKEEVFAMLRAIQFERLADTLESVSQSLSPGAYLKALATAYASYAEREPHGYRLLYMVHLHQTRPYPAMEAGQLRTQQLLSNGTRRAVKAGELAGDPAVLAHTLWASIHGLVSLDLAGQLTRGATFKKLFPAMLQQLIPTA